MSILFGDMLWYVSPLFFFPTVSLIHSLLLFIQCIFFNCSLYISHVLGVCFPFVLHVLVATDAILCLNRIL